MSAQHTVRDVDSIAREGMKAQKEGRLPAAVQAFRAVAEARPECAASQHNLGLVLFQTNEFRSAIRVLERAVALAPKLEPARLNLARALLQEHDTEGARAQCEAAIRDHPRSYAAHSLSGFIFEVSGEANLAEAAYRKASKLAPLCAAPWCGLARLGRLKDPARLEAVLAKGEAAPSERAALYFALGQTYERRGQYDLAFRRFARGNALRTTGYDADRQDALVQRVIDCHDAEFLAAGEGAGNPTEAPVFVVGMPRSGTSLVEQVLACHPAVKPLGERAELGILARDAHLAVPTASQFPESIAELTPLIADAMGSAYLTEVGGIPEGIERLVDKAPANFLLLGLARRIFPNARVVHCVRDPRDTCLSSFFQDFGDLNVRFSTSLDDLARHYRGYSAVMDHWRAVQPLAMHDVAYEELVANPEREVRRLLDFLELPWDPACLEFHEAGRAVMTASSQQVREPFHTRSCGRWQNYAEHLGPLAEL